MSMFANEHPQTLQGTIGVQGCSSQMAGLLLPLLSGRRGECYPAEDIRRHVHCVCNGPLGIALLPFPPLFLPALILIVIGVLEAGMLQGISDNALDGYLNAIKDSTLAEWA